jgi:hypothetical protein
MFKGIPQRGATPIEIKIVIKIRRLLEIDFDHDFDFDIDSEFPRFENKISLVLPLVTIACFTGNR